MENNIISIAKNFNQEHGRAMTIEEAFSKVADQNWGITWKEIAEVYAESVKQQEAKEQFSRPQITLQFERAKVIEEVQYQLDLWLSPENSKQYWEVKTIITGLKSHPLDTNEK